MILEWNALLCCRVVIIATCLWTTDSFAQSPKTLQGRGGPILSISFSPDGKTCAAGGGRKSISLWDTTSWKVRHSLTGSGFVRDMAFSPDGSILAAAGSNNVSAERQGTITLWDVKARNQKRTLTAHGDEALAVAFSADGKTLASGGIDGTIVLWDVATGNQVQLLKGHDTTVRSVNISADGKILASADEGKVVKLWDLSTGKEKWSHEQHGSDCALSTDGSLLIYFSHRSINLLDVKRLRNKAWLRDVNYCEITSFALSPSGKILASIIYDDDGEMTIALSDVKTGTVMRTIQATAKVGYSITFSPSGTLLAYCSLGGTIEIVSVDDEK